MKHTSQVVDCSTFALDMFTQILTAFLSNLASQIAPGRLKFKPASFFPLKKQELGLKKKKHVQMDGKCDEKGYMSVEITKKDIFKKPTSRETRNKM